MTDPPAEPPGRPPAMVYLEVTNTLATPGVSGIQRIVRQLLVHLRSDPDPGAPIRFVPVTWCSGCGGFRQLTPSERQGLTGPVAPPPPGRLERLPGRAQPIVEWFTKLALVRSARARLASALAERRHPDAHTDLRVDPAEVADVWLDVESCWHDPEDRSTLLPRLRRHGVLTTALVADVLPLTRPEFFDPGMRRIFGGWITAHLTSSPWLMAISSFTASEVGDVAVGLGLTPPEVEVIRLGADFVESRPPSAPAGDPDAPAHVGPPPLPPGVGRYLLCVSTLEPRKNHTLILDGFDRLRRTEPDLGLVLIGKEGWLVDELVRRITRHPEFGTRLLWLKRVGDAELDRWYRHAVCVLMPSHTEGLGLGVVESLARGVPVISSNGGALPEVGGTGVDLIDPTDTAALVDVVARHLHDPEFHRRRREEAASFVPPRWVDTAVALEGSILRHLGDASRRATGTAVPPN